MKYDKPSKATNITKTGLYNIDKDVAQLEFANIVGRKAKWCS